MDTLFLYNTKTLKEKFKTKVFAGDNNITKINVQIPDNIGGYPKKDCEFNLRAIIPEGNLSYIINPNEPYFYITNDITEKAQTVKLMMIITHEGNVIGRTNTVDLVVNEPAEAPDPPLTPREEFDEIIAEQRAEIAEQAETISEQATEIETKDGQISELNDEITEKDGQITELTNENTRLENLTDTQRETIQYMVDNPPAPKLETPNPINPPSEDITIRPTADNVGFTVIPLKGMKLQEKTAISTDTKQEITPSEGYDGLSKVTIEPILGGVFLEEPDEYNNPTRIVIRSYNKITFNFLFTQFPTLKEVQFVNSDLIEGLNGDTFRGLLALEKVNLPENLVAVPLQAFSNCANLKSIHLPRVTSIGANAFVGCSLLKTINLPNSIQSIGYNSFGSLTSLEYVDIENGFNANSLSLSASTLYSHDTILSWFNAFADRTGLTAYTLTIGTTNLNKMTAEEKAIATNKNWNLA